MEKNELNILIGGPAGSGIEKSGKTLTLSFVRAGYHVFANVEHMSQIRGGNNYLRIRVDTSPHECHVEKIDVMIALDKQTIEDHSEEMNEGGVVIFDREGIGLDDGFDFGNATGLDVPLKKMAEELGNPVIANAISLGVVYGLIGFDPVRLKKVLAGIFSKKGAEIIALNEKAVQAGADFVQEKRKIPTSVGMTSAGMTELGEGDSERRMFLEGNDAVCIGAVKAGCKFVGEYPMTPSSSVLHFMAKWAEKYGIVVKHTEDEIAACNSIIGAGFAGARSMTGTSGGGFALMSEAVGLASMNEVPIVIVNVMRPGPATGQPTRSEQGDLRQMIHAGQGDPVKIILLPGDVKECANFGFEAFNLAEKYQMPVLIGYDKYMGEGYFTTEPFEFKGMKIDRGKLLTQEELDRVDDYKRYLRTEDGISPRAIPGMKGGIHRATSDEHDEHGDILEDAENRKLMVEKRLKKLEVALKDLPEPELIGESDADLTFVTWGSGKSICKEAVEILAERGVKANILQIKTAFPFHTEKTRELLSRCKRMVLVEHNATGQMGGVIAENTGVLIDEKVLRYDGRPMTAMYVAERVLVAKNGVGPVAKEAAPDKTGERENEHSELLNKRSPLSRG